MTKIKSALVIGGGIAGPVTALALRKAGIEATVHEAHPAAADGVGAMLTLAPNGLNALRIIEADQAVDAIGHPVPGVVMADSAGNELSEFAGFPELPATRAMARADLLRALADHAVARGVRIEYGNRLVTATDTADGVTATFTDGSTATGDILIGADGIRSTVRPLIDPGASGPAYGGVLSFGGPATGGGVRTKPGMMYFAFGQAFLGYWTTPDGRIIWFGSLPQAEPLSTAQVRQVPAADWLARLRDLYAGHQPGQTLLEHTDPDEMYIVGPMEFMPSVPHWHRGRMVLVGDSAHAPSSSSGQGASQAIESAIELARCLRDLPDPATAFAPTSTYAAPGSTRSPETPPPRTRPKPPTPATNRPFPPPSRCSPRCTATTSTGTHPSPHGRPRNKASRHTPDPMAKEQSGDWPGQAALRALPVAESWSVVLPWVVAFWAGRCRVRGEAVMAVRLKLGNYETVEGDPLGRAHIGYFPRMTEAEA